MQIHVNRVDSNADIKFENFIFRNWLKIVFFCLYQKTELSKLENGELKRVKAEVNKLRELQLSQKDSYESEVQGLKVEISRLTKDLHDRTKTMANLSEESGQMEAQLRNEVEAQERRQAELQVCSKVGTVWAGFSLQSCTHIFHHQHLKCKRYFLHFFSRIS